MRTLLLSIALISCVVLPADSADAPKKGKGKGGKGKALKRDDAILVAEMRQAYHVLDNAEPIFHGHRGKAMHQLNLAIKSLEHEMHAKGMKGKHEKHPKVGRKFSLEEVAQAKNNVGDVLKALSTMKSTKHRAHAIEHLGKSLADLELAITSVRTRGPKNGAAPGDAKTPPKAIIKKK